jgi:hypothetical protein
VSHTHAVLVAIKVCVVSLCVSLSACVSVYSASTLFGHTSSSGRVRGAAVDQYNLLPPLQVIQILSQNASVTLSVVKDYVSSRMLAEDKQIEEVRTGGGGVWQRREGGVYAFMYICMCVIVCM